MRCEEGEVLPEYAVNEEGSFLIVEGPEVRKINQSGRKMFVSKYERIQIAALMNQEPRD